MISPAVALGHIRAILAKAYGPDLDGSERGELVSRHFLMDLRDVVRNTLPGAPPELGACEDCEGLRSRLRNIYHLTLNYHDAGLAVRAVREASGPGAPAPVWKFEDGCLQWPGGGMNLAMLQALLAPAGLVIVKRSADV